MDDSDLEAFRTRARLMLVEQLVLRNALFDPVIRLDISLETSQQKLKDWLDKNADVIDKAYGGALRDPAKTALFADEVREIVDEQKKKIDSMVEQFHAKRT